MSYGHLVHRYAGLGDALFLNTVAFFLARQECSRVLVGTNHPALFQGNAMVHRLPVRSRKWGVRLARLLAKSGLVSKVHYLDYTDAARRESREHILAVLARRVGLNSVPQRPCLFLAQDELRQHRLPDSGKPWIAMQSAGQTAWTPNKEWYPARFQAVAAALRPGYRIVQLGLAPDPKLTADLDLRGLVTPRQAAAALASCAFFIGQAGYLMHAAAALKVPAVIIYGGFEGPWQSGYPWNENLFTALDCSPCWLRGPCPHARQCMDAIQVNDVLGALGRLRQQAGIGGAERASEIGFRCA